MKNIYVNYENKEVLNETQYQEKINELYNELLSDKASKEEFIEENYSPSEVYNHLMEDETFIDKDWSDICLENATDTLREEYECIRI